MINQSFNMNLMERFMQVFNSASDALVKNLEKESGKDCTDILNYTNFSALEIACENLMGIKLKPEENAAEEEYIEKTKVMLRIVGVRFFSFWQRFETIFLMFSKHSKIYLDYVGTLKKFTLDVIERRSKTFKEERKEVGTENDFGIKKKAALMDILLEESERGTLTYEDIREEIDTFMVAGHETSAGILSFALFELARQPEAQQTLYEEIMAIAPEGDISMDQLNDMQYLECAVKEALRMYPQVPFMERQIIEEFELDGIKYPIGTVFSIPIINMQNDPDLFPDPGTYDPSRFLPENADKIPKYNYLPFSAGPRICIGYKYAMYSAKCSLAKVIREYEVLPVPGFNVQLEFQITLKSVTGINIRLKKRKHQR
nr:cytochrome P450 4d8-like [Leptinotarsa decemlineata]